MGVTITLKASHLVNDEGQRARVYGIQPENFRKKTLAKDADEGAKPAFRHDGCNFLIPKGSPAEQMLIDAIESAANEKLLDKASGWIRKNLGEGKATDNCCLRDADERDEVTEDFAGHFQLNGKSYRRILIMTPAGLTVGEALDEDQDGDELPEDDRVYNGQHLGALKVEVWGYTKGKSGVACNVLGWRGYDDEAEQMESGGGETASEGDLGFDEDEEDTSSKKKAAPKKKAPARK
ncbi:MAG: DUF2815 family protein [Escherichia coli]|nr:DUF2815 family protein [Escherichia coli]QVV96932.1 hypothetical protein [Kosakonia phage Kc259]